MHEHVPEVRRRFTSIAIDIMEKLYRLYEIFGLLSWGRICDRPITICILLATYILVEIMLPISESPCRL